MFFLQPTKKHDHCLFVMAAYIFEAVRHPEESPPVQRRVSSRSWSNILADCKERVKRSHSESRGEGRSRSPLECQQWVMEFVPLKSVAWKRKKICREWRKVRSWIEKIVESPKLRIRSWPRCIEWPILGFQEIQRDMIGAIRAKFLQV